MTAIRQVDGRSYSETTRRDKPLAGPQGFALDCGAMNRICEADGRVRILGVDPAVTGPTGYGIVESVGRGYRALHFGALRVDGKRNSETTGVTLEKVHRVLCHVIEEFSPTAVAVESVFTALNMRTALRLAEVRGVVLLAAAQYGIPSYSYSPREVKASVTGYGHAEKRQMQLMVRALLSMPQIPEPPDAADALAVALCHLQAKNFRGRLGLPETMTIPRPRRSRTQAAATSDNVTPPRLERIESIR